MAYTTLTLCSRNILQLPLAEALNRHQNHNFEVLHEGMLLNIRNLLPFVTLSLPSQLQSRLLASALYLADSSQRDTLTLPENEHHHFQSV